MVSNPSLRVCVTLGNNILNCFFTRKNSANKTYFIRYEDLISVRCLKVAMHHLSARKIGSYNYFDLHLERLMSHLGSKPKVWTQTSDD